jgi:hypothetical protein
MATQAILAEAFGLQQAAVNGGSQLPQILPAAQALIHAKVVRVINGSFGTEGAVLLEVLLDPECLKTICSVGCTPLCSTWVRN